MDLQAKAASDHASTPAIMTPAVVAATSSQYARRGETLCESSITLTYPPVRNANAAARKIETAKQYAAYSQAKERLMLRTVRQKDLGENEPCYPQHQHGREVAAGARQRINSCENPRKSGQGAGLP